jgi:uncharacterized protein YbcI
MEPTEREMSPLARLAAEMVSLHKAHFGRGPTKSVARSAGDDLVVVALEDSLVPAERTLLDIGEERRVTETRLAFQKATADVFVDAAERIMGRKVRSFTSALDAPMGISYELFMFEPRTGAGNQPDAARRPTEIGRAQGGADA